MQLAYRLAQSWFNDTLGTDSAKLKVTTLFRGEGRDGSH
jgi:hypothetical protein